MMFNDSETGPVMHIFTSIISNYNPMAAWIFQHNVVELCAAVKGLVILESARRYDAERVICFDSDNVCFFWYSGDRALAGSL